jgi:ADP-heptose:LPS heptosyltransferase
VISSKHFKDRPEREWYMEIARELGYCGPTPDVKIFHSRRWFDIPDGTVAIAPGTVSERWSIKGWHYYDKLARYFKSVVLVGREGDVRPESSWPENVKSYIGKLSLSDTTSLMAQCKAFVGNDGGLAHICSALGVPTYVIFGPTSTVKNCPRHGMVVSLDPEMDCQPCQFTDRFLKCRSRECMDRLLVEDVADRISRHHPSLISE